MSIAEVNSMIAMLSVPQQKALLEKWAAKLGLSIKEKKLSPEDQALLIATKKGIKGKLVSKEDIMNILKNED